MSRTDGDIPSSEAPPDGRPERRLSGLAVSPGIGIGPFFGLEEARAQVARRPIGAEELAAENLRLDAAVAQSRKQIVKLRARLSAMPEAGQTEMAPLLDAYLQMLGPSRLLRQARKRMGDQLVSAEAALLDEADAIGAAMMAAQPGSATAQRQADEVREIARRLVRNLTGTPFRSYAQLPDGVVLAVDALRPSDVLLLDPARLQGVVTEEGGADGHTSVMLRALGLPAVLGVAGLMAMMRPGETGIVDGGSGAVVLGPGAEAMADARRGAAALAKERQKLARLRNVPAETACGEAVDLHANMELPGEIPMIAASGAPAIGLLRTEFLFMQNETLPDEEAQAEQYRAIIEAMGGGTVTLRVLDWGGEKEGSVLPGDAASIALNPAAPNPALGLRGVRLLLRRQELFETQLGAILRAANAGPTRIMLPMVTNVAEVHAARDTLEKVAKRLRRRGVPIPDKLPPLGIMVETPGAALSADALALEADFFAIGTNDLTMYTLAVDRADTELAPLYDPLHPAVLRLVQYTTEAALRLRKPVSICGEIASDPRMIPLLLGMGLRCFSMHAAALPRVKQAVRGLRIDDCARLARRVLEEPDPARVRALMAGG